MSKKSLEEVWFKMQQDMQTKKITEQQTEQQLFDQREAQRKEWLERRRIYESLASSSSAAGAGSAGGLNLKKWVTYINTIWLYPMADIQSVIDTTSINFTQNGSDYIFSSLQDLADFYDEVYSETANSNPGSNPGYSLGVGTVCESLRDQIFLKLSNGHIVVKWQLMKQITNQSDLPAGGDSPNGTIGYGLIYCDWDLDGVQDPPVDGNGIGINPPIGAYTDPLRFKYA